MNPRGTELPAVASPQTTPVMRPNATDETAVRLANRAAVRKAIGTCIEGRDPGAAARLVDTRDSLQNPFYSGD